MNNFKLSSIKFSDFDEINIQKTEKGSSSKSTSI